MSEVACPHCGKANAEAYNYCSVCGTESPSRRLAEEANARHASDKKSVERTKTGTILVIAAVLLNWVPYIDYLGLLLGTIGVILIILGSEVFGGHHHGMAIMAVIVFLIGDMIAFGVALGIASSIGTASISLITNQFDIYIASSVIVDFSYVLILLSLENSVGRALVISGFFSTILITVYVAIIIQPLIITIVKNPSEAQYLTNQISGLSGLHLLWVIPAVLTAIGYLTVIRRIDKGEIPKGAALVDAPRAK